MVCVSETYPQVKLLINSHGWYLPHDCVKLVCNNTFTVRRFSSCHTIYIWWVYLTITRHCHWSTSPLTALSLRPAQACFVCVEHWGHLWSYSHRLSQQTTRLPTSSNRPFWGLPPTASPPLLSQLRSSFCLRLCDYLLPSMEFYPISEGLIRLNPCVPHLKVAHAQELAKKLTW